MKIAIIGTDPAGLYLACLVKARKTDAEITILDTGAPDRDAAPPHILVNPVKPELKLADAELGARIMAAASRTHGIVIRRDGETIRAAGHGYATIRAATLATILRDRAIGLGCRIEQAALGSRKPSQLGDLVVIADGAESVARAALADDFKPQLSAGKTRLMVFSADRSIEVPTFLFRRTPGGVFTAYLLPDGQGTSTLTVEATAVTLAAAGLEGAGADKSTDYCAKLFAPDLDSRHISPRSAGWRPFVAVRNASWTSRNTVLIGAAAYNAHHSIGLGVRSGFEDAEALSTLIGDGSHLEDALARFEAARRPRAESLQRASAASQTWFEHVGRYIDMNLPQFAYACLTRSMRINHEQMRGLAPSLTEAVETLIAGGARSKANRPPPPMFTPLTLRDLTIPNRIAMSPMCMYNAIDRDGTVGDFHLVHYGSRAQGGAGLVITEMTDVSPEGRISAHCAGLYKPEHVAAWKRVTDFVHEKTQSKIGVQLGHAGRKGGELRPWERSGAKGPRWQTIAPSAIPFAKDGVPPREMTRADMDRLVGAYAAATRMADQAGFDLVELHFAHGYLLSTFISPLSNTRTDQYGGSLANRVRFPMEVFEAVRAAWPRNKPTCVRISAYDWMEGGTTIEDAIAIGRMLKDAGNDILSVSTGGVVGVRPTAGRLYQATFSDQIRNELKIMTMNVGAMASHGDINAMIAAGRADMCALARGHLFDPYFTRHAAFQQDYADLAWPQEYERAQTLEMRDF
jgi:anthraniloyl-CoA monooxygenase